MSRTVFILNGPNLNLLGEREPEIYGYATLADVEAACRGLASENGIEIRFHQSNAEHQIIDWIHEARGLAEGIIINPAAFTHTSLAVLDALNTFEGLVYEVHLSNYHKRESFRQFSFVSQRADATMAGFGAQGYTLAVRAMTDALNG